MTQEAITLAGWTLYPSKIKDDLLLLGGGIRRSLSGKAFRKITAKKKRISLTWDALSPEERQLLEIIFTSGDSSSIAVACATRSINGSFIQADEARSFDDLGDSDYKAFSLTLEEV